MGFRALTRQQGWKALDCIIGQLGHIATGPQIYGVTSFCTLFDTHLVPHQPKLLIYCRAMAVVSSSSGKCKFLGIGVFRASRLAGCRVEGF